MPKGVTPHAMSERLRLQYENEHKGICDRIPEYEKYVAANPDDKYAAGQLRYWKEREKFLAEKIGLAINRSTRPTE